MSVMWRDAVPEPVWESNGREGGGNEPDPSGHGLLAAPLRGAALCECALALERAGRGREAIDHGSKAVEFVRTLLRLANREDLRMLCGCLEQIEGMLHRQSRRVDAIQVAHDLVTFRRNLAAGGGADDIAAFAESLSALATAQAGFGRISEAATVAQEEVALRRELARSGDAERSCELAGALRNWGRWLGRTDADADHALAPLDEALEILRPLAEAGSAAARAARAQTEFAIATLLGDRGRPIKAIAPGLRAVAVHRDLARAGAQGAEPELAKSLHNVSIWFAQAGRRAEALVAIDEAVMMYRALARREVADGQRDLAWSLVTRGNRLLDMRQNDEARSAFREAGTLVLRLPIHNAKLWAWLASVPATQLSEPQDLWSFHVPLLQRLAHRGPKWSDEGASALAKLEEKVRWHVIGLVMSATAVQDGRSDADVAALLDPALGEGVLQWARAERAISRPCAEARAWTIRPHRRDG